MRTKAKGKQILPKVLSMVGNVVLASLTADGTSAYYLFRKFDDLQAVSNKQLQNTVRYAVDKRYIVVMRKKGQEHIALTKKGRHVVDKQVIKNLRPIRQKVWDKKWRVVMFDIPEADKKARDGFAANLKRIGMVQMQKSVFVYPYPCAEEIQALTNFHQVGPYLSCLVAESLTPSTKLRSHFNLG